MKNKTNLSITLIVLTGIIFSSCQKFLERDITGEKVVLNSPPTGAHVTNYTQTFWWGEVEGASKYQLQVVSPSFEYTTKLWLDTTLSTNQFAFTFSPDSITWRVKAINDAYETKYTESYFVVDSTEKPQPVNLLEPAIDACLNNTAVKFSWSVAKNATDYRFVLKLGDDVVYTAITTETKMTFPDETNNYPDITDGNYNWTVCSNNLNGNSEYATNRKLIIDRTAPQKPTILKPAYNETVSSFSLAWKHPDNSGSALTDSLIIYKSDSLNNISEYTRQQLNDTVYEETDPSESLYLFKVKSIDKAGNVGEWSGLQRFYFKKEE